MPHQQTPFETLFADLPRSNTTVLGTAFELVSDFALLSSHEYGPLIATIERYEEYARRERLDVLTDTGIDRIITTRSGDIWAVQNKGYGGVNDRVPFGDFNNFLVRGHAINASRLLLVTSGAGITSNSEDNNRSMGGRVVVLNRDWLNKIETYPETFPLLREAVLSKDPTRISRGGRYELRDHQIEAVDQVTAGLRSNSEVQFVSACGTGKTVTSQAIAERLEARTVMFFVPSLSLMKQTIEAWHRQSEPVGMHAIAVCSDESVEKDTVRVGDQEFRCEVVRDPARIAEFLRECAERGDGVPAVVFSTYHSANLVVRAQHDYHAPEFDFMFADEAHRLVGTTTEGARRGEVVKRKDDGKRRALVRYRVYATATPVQMSSAIMAKAKKYGSKPMDSMGPESDTFGPEAYRLTFGEAIDRRILTDYQLAVIAVSDKDRAEFINQRGYVEFEGDKGILDAQTFAALQAVRQAYAAGYKRIVTYHSYVKDARRFAELLNSMPDLPGAAAVYGELPAKERTRRIGRLEEDDGYIITNVRCLNEGVDLPSLDAIVFTDPKSSEVDIAQSVGRVLRLSPGKDVGLVIIPVAVPTESWETGEMEQSDLEAHQEGTGPFRTVIDVMLGLADQDDTIRQIIHDVKFGLGKRRNQKGMQKDVAPDPDDLTPDLDDYIGDVVGEDGSIDRTMKAPFPRDTTSILGGGKITLHAPGMTPDLLEQLAASMRTAFIARTTGTRQSDAELFTNSFLQRCDVTTKQAVRMTEKLYHLVASGLDERDAVRQVIAGVPPREAAA